MFWTQLLGGRKHSRGHFQRIKVFLFLITMTVCAKAICILQPKLWRCIARPLLPPYEYFDFRQEGMRSSSSWNQIWSSRSGTKEGFETRVSYTNSFKSDCDRASPNSISRSINNKQIKTWIVIHILPKDAPVRSISAPVFQGFTYKWRANKILHIPNWPNHNRRLFISWIEFSTLSKKTVPP